MKGLDFLTRRRQAAKRHHSTLEKKVGGPREEIPGPREAMKQVVEVQKKATNMVTDSNAEIPHAGTQVEDETSKVLNTAELHGTTQTVWSEEINSDWDKEAIKELESTPKVLNTVELEETAGQTAEMQGTAKRILSKEIPSDWNTEAVKVPEETPSTAGRPGRSSTGNRTALTPGSTSGDGPDRPPPTS